MPNRMWLVILPTNNIEEGHTVPLLNIEPSNDTIV
jgi:hypothetical protein